MTMFTAAVCFTSSVITMVRDSGALSQQRQQSYITGVSGSSRDSSTVYRLQRLDISTSAPFVPLIDELDE